MSAALIDKDKLIEACKLLDVYVHGKMVANIFKDDSGAFVLQYMESAKPSDFISITMPVRREPWRSKILHPFFHMNFPEGAMRIGMMRKFGREISSDEMTVLGLIGASLIGSVKVVPHGFPLDWRSAPDINTELLMDTPDAGAYFDELIDACVGQGISGVMPKVITSDQSRRTVLGSRWIYKHDKDISGEANYVGASMNEYLCLRAAARSGLKVSDCAISKDGHTIAIRRFDEPGVRFEDFCSLSGVRGDQKYQGSMERIARIIGKISCQPSQDKETLLRAHILNMIVQNGDAHLKNFGVLYTNLNDIRLSPTFDIVSTRVFHGMYGDLPALQMGGEKRWTLSDDFLQFATHECGVHPARTYKIMEEVINGVNKTMPDIAKAAEKHEWFREQGKMMILFWTEGIAMALNETMPSDEEVLSKFKLSGVDPDYFETPDPEQDYLSQFM